MSSFIRQYKIEPTNFWHIKVIFHFNIHTIWTFPIKLKKEQNQNDLLITLICLPGIRTKASNKFRYRESLFGQSFGVLKIVWA